MTDSMRPEPAPVATADFEARLVELRQRFVERTRRDGDTVRGLRTRLDAGEALAGDLLRDLTRTVHGLAGAAGVFGFDEISEAAHRAELNLRHLDGVFGDPRPLLDVLEARLAALWSSSGVAT
jgi:HPt (histidine-containing phosphotransfer) domain-containing protein